MKLSDRITRIPDPEGNAWALFDRAREMQAQGINVTMLSIGDHDERTPDLLLNRMYNAARAGNTGYAPLMGSADLRQAIAERVSRTTGSPTAPRQVAVTPGGQMALFNAFLAVLDPGDHAVIVDPYYATYPLTVRAAGGVPVTARADPDRGFQIDLDSLAAAADGARALLINSPNNPTGAVYSRQTLEGIAEIVRTNDLWLISDEVYDSQVWDGHHLSPRALPGLAERTILIGSLSKSHRMTGSRVGWLVGPDALVDALPDLAVASTYGIPGFIQEAALHALRHGQEVEADVHATYARRRNLAIAALAGANRIRLSPPQGAMYVMLDIRATGCTAQDFARELLEEDHIAVMPGDGFGRSARGHLRIALTVEDERLRRALLQIRKRADS
ncbi:MAG: aminotransferase class I/II-fold pyridoxal phosphate-dependent enzyme [Pseudomonadota bacterium]